MWIVTSRYLNTLRVGVRVKSGNNKKINITVGGNVFGVADIKSDAPAIPFVCTHMGAGVRGGV